MLMLSRKRGERIVIGSNIEVTLLDVCGDRVRIGFIASPEIAIHRAEVHRGIQDDDHREPKLLIDPKKPDDIALKNWAGSTTNQFHDC